MNNALISIVVPLYNKESSIAQCIDTILEQTYQDWECIIIDDGSTDNSACIVKSYTDPRIKYHYQNNAGVSSARNNGIKLATGEWIVFQDADDIFLPNALESLLRTVEKYKTKVGTCNYKTENGDYSRINREMYEGVVQNKFKEFFYHRVFIRTGSTIFHRSVFDKVTFDTRYQRWEDIKFACEVLELFEVAYTPDVVFVYTDDCRGLSKALKDWTRDYTFFLELRGKSFWEKMVLLNVLGIGISCYPQYRTKLLVKYWYMLPLLALKKYLNNHR